MARIDDYQQARDLAARELAGGTAEEIAGRAGLHLSEDSRLRAEFLGKIYDIAYPQFSFTDTGSPSADVPLQEQVLILHYLQGCRPVLIGRWIAFREIPGAGFYFGAFVKRAVDPLKQAFGAHVERLHRAAVEILTEKFGAPPKMLEADYDHGRNFEEAQWAAAALKGAPVDTGDAGYRFAPLPYAPVQIILWEGDEEFPAEANILFDATIGDYLSPEDAAWLASLVVYRLIGAAR